MPDGYLIKSLIEEFSLLSQSRIAAQSELCIEPGDIGSQITRLPGIWFFLLRRSSLTAAKIYFH